MVGTKKEKKLFVIIMSIVILFNTSSCAVNEKSNPVDTIITNVETKEVNEKSDSVDIITTTDQNVEDEKVSISAEIKEDKPFKDISLCNSAYRMFYGEWEIVEIRDYENIPITDPNDRHYGGNKISSVIYIKDQETGEVQKGATRYLDDKEEFVYLPLDKEELESYAAKIIGNKMVFEPSYIKCNDQYIIHDPIYQIYIHPKPREMIKLYGVTDWYNMGWEELEYNSEFRSSPYYIPVGIHNFMEISPCYNGECTNFMIIDDDTLIGL